MSTETFSAFFALMALLSLSGAAAVAAGGVVWALAPAARPALGRWREDLGEAALPLAWLVASVATAGSLYYSEVAHFEPCRLCWFQRIAMYPLVAILSLALLRRDRGIRPYGLLLAAGGLPISVYHYQLQLFPSQGGGVCGTGPPCTLKYVEQFGFVTIPFMAGAGFAAIIALLAVAAPGGVVDVDSEVDLEVET